MIARPKSSIFQGVFIKAAACPDPERGATVFLKTLQSFLFVH
jgi:hypothetical protein